MELVKEFAENYVKNLKNDEIVDVYNKVHNDKIAFIDRVKFVNELNKLTKDELINTMLNSEIGNESNFNMIIAYIKDGKITSFCAYGGDYPDDEFEDWLKYCIKSKIIEICTKKLEGIILNDVLNI